MEDSPLLDDRRSGMAKLLSLFSTAALSQDPNRWINLARSLAVQLRSPSIDWRDLARALEHVRTNAAGSASSGLFDRAALLAMRLSSSAESPKASVDMLDVCAPGVAPEKMLRSVVAILQRQIPFDLVSYAEYYHGAEAAEGTTLVRGRFAMDDGVEFRWPARWVAIPEGIARWAEGDVRWVADSEEFYKEHPQAEPLRNNIVTREYEKRGATSYLVAPLLDGGRVKAILTIARRRNSPHGPFGQADQYKLDALCMERVVRRVNEAFDMRTQVIAKDIVALFTPQANPVVLAQEFVKKLCRGFEWEYVGLFRVNRARDKFEVAAEHDAHGDLKVSAGYEQDLTAGMLGRTLKERYPLYVPDVTKKPAPHGYIRVTPSQASALTFPIKMGPDSNAEIEWILDLESSQFDAFPYPEQELLRRTVVEVERAVALWFEARLAAALLNAVGQGLSSSAAARASNGPTPPRGNCLACRRTSNCREMTRLATLRHTPSTGRLSSLSPEIRFRARASTFD
jgi:GAF domain-containing protein